MNYQTAAKEAIKAFDSYRRSTLVKEIENTAEFRQLTVYESTGCNNKIRHVLFGLQFCSKNGDNYREIMISVFDNSYLQHPATGYSTDVRLYTIEVVK
jgi:hypothetical protein